MPAITYRAARPNPYLSELVTWLGQMKAALNQPHPRDVIAHHVEIAQLVDRGVSRLYSQGVGRGF